MRTSYEQGQATQILARTPGTLRALLVDLPEMWIHGNDGPGTFSPFDVVGHLIDGEETDWIPRAKIILAGGTSPRFEPYDRFRHRARNAGRPLLSLLDEFARLRKANLDTLGSWKLTPQALDLRGEHPSFGTVTLRQLLAAWVVHDLGHLAQVSRVMARQYREEVGPWVEFMPVLIDRQKELLRHFLAALAYRTQKALRGAPADFGAFCAGSDARTPSELVRHMTSVLGYARTCFVGGRYRPEPLPTLAEEVGRFHEMLDLLAREIVKGTPMLEGMTAERLLQGPFSDAMTHAGQLAMLRRLAGFPVPPENFIRAEVDPARLGTDQALPAAPDGVWKEAPKGWIPPAPEGDSG